MPEDQYTADTANAALPLVRAIVSDIVDLETRVRAAMGDYRSLKAERDARQDKLNEARRLLGDLVAERDACEDELAELGVRLGDAERGICDFPAEVDGELVFLCWELGEDRVAYYHPRNGGFAERRPLPVPVSVD